MLSNHTRAVLNLCGQYSQGTLATPMTNSSEERRGSQPVAFEQVDDGVVSIVVRQRGLPNTGSIRQRVLWTPLDPERDLLSRTSARGSVKDRHVVYADHGAQPCADTAQALREVERASPAL
ncbi:hypothetical protein GCM10027590_19290 [Nocardiopsis nanhaiensis]